MTRPAIPSRDEVLTALAQLQAHAESTGRQPAVAPRPALLAGRQKGLRPGPGYAYGAGSLPAVDPSLLARFHPTLYHMAEDGTWPSIRQRGLLSTQAIIDLYQPDDDVRARIVSAVRQDKITLTSPELGDMTIRDQRPAKFIADCMHDGVSPQDYLNTLNGRVFFWLHLSRLARLLNARLYRNSRHTVLQVDTARLVGAYSGRVQLAPYNTGSMHVPNTPKRGPAVFTDLADYPYEQWLAKRGRSTEPVVELTIRYAVPDIASFVTKVETWEGGRPIAVLYSDTTPKLGPGQR